MSTVHKRYLERLRGSLGASLEIESNGSDMIDGESERGGTKKKMDTATKDEKQRLSSPPRLLVVILTECCYMYIERIEASYE